jgi:hypothetical protein
MKATQQNERDRPRPSDQQRRHTPGKGGTVKSLATDRAMKPRDVVKR